MISLGNMPITEASTAQDLANSSQQCILSCIETIESFQGSSDISNIEVIKCHLSQKLREMREIQDIASKKVEVLEKSNLSMHFKMIKIVDKILGVVVPMLMLEQLIEVSMHSDEDHTSPIFSYITLSVMGINVLTSKLQDYIIVKLSKRSDILSILKLIAKDRSLISQFDSAIYMLKRMSTFGLMGNSVTTINKPTKWANPWGCQVSYHQELRNVLFEHLSTHKEAKHFSLKKESIDSRKNSLVLLNSQFSLQSLLKRLCFDIELLDISIYYNDSLFSLEINMDPIVDELDSCMQVSSDRIKAIHNFLKQDSCEAISLEESIQFLKEKYLQIEFIFTVVDKIASSSKNKSLLHSGKILVVCSIARFVFDSSSIFIEGNQSLLSDNDSWVTRGASMLFYICGQCISYTSSFMTDIYEKINQLKVTFSLINNQRFFLSYLGGMIEIFIYLNSLLEIDADKIDKKDMDRMISDSARMIKKKVDSIPRSISKDVKRSLSQKGLKRLLYKKYKQNRCIDREDIESLDAYSSDSDADQDLSKCEPSGAYALSVKDFCFSNNSLDVLLDEDDDSLTSEFIGDYSEIVEDKKVYTISGTNSKSEDRESTKDKIERSIADHVFHYNHNGPNSYNVI